MEARQIEMQYFRKMKVYSKVDKETALKESGGKPPIRVRWVDTNKGTAAAPNIRSRLVAMEFRRENRPDLYSATPPLEAVRMVVAMAAAAPYEPNESDPVCLMHLDVSRAYFHALCKRPTFIHIPDEDYEAGDEWKLGRLRVSMYGTREAARNWEDTYSDILEKAGFRRGISTPCVFTHDSREIRIVVHGDDFLAIGRESQLKWYKAEMEKSLEVKTTMIGPSRRHDKQLTMLNRQVTWRKDGISWAADKRHVEEMLKDLNLKDANGVACPSTEDIRDIGVKRETGTPMSDREATNFRSIIARGNYLALDRPDIQFTSRAISKGMSRPVTSDMQYLRHMGRYLKRMPELAYVYKWQRGLGDIVVQTDSDWAGDRADRNSVSGGAIYLGNMLLKTWSKEQKQKALSSGEAELYAANMGASEGLGIQSLAKDFGIQAKVRVEVDASAAVGIIQRRGLGKLRHVHTQDLWSQEAVRRGAFTIRRIDGSTNTSDIGTKPLGRALMEKHLLTMGMESVTCKEPCDIDEWSQS